MTVGNVVLALEVNGRTIMMTPPGFPDYGNLSLGAIAIAHTRLKEVVGIGRNGSNDPIHLRSTVALLEDIGIPEAKRSKEVAHHLAGPVTRTPASSPCRNLVGQALVILRNSGAQLDPPKHNTLVRKTHSPLKVLRPGLLGLPIMPKNTLMSSLDVTMDGLNKPTTAKVISLPTGFEKGSGRFLLCNPHEAPKLCTSLVAVQKLELEGVTQLLMLMDGKGSPISRSTARVGHDLFPVLGGAMELPRTHEAQHPSITMAGPSFGLVGGNRGRSDLLLGHKHRRATRKGFDVATPHLQGSLEVARNSVGGRPMVDVVLGPVVVRRKQNSDHGIALALCDAHALLEVVDTLGQHQQRNCRSVVKRQRKLKLALN